MVAAGILLSRIAGLIRDRVFAHYFGNSDAADAFRAAFRIPNFLQNLFGEGVLSASFIPVYARLRAEQQDEQAGKLAEAIFALLFVATTVLVALGIFATPYADRCHRPGLSRRKARSSRFAWCAYCFPAPACWCSAPGAWEFSTAIAGFFFPTRRR